MRVTIVENDGARTLNQPTLSVAYGGSVDARLGEDGWVPSEAVYRVWLTTEDVILQSPPQVRRGTVVFDAGWSSLGGATLRRAVSVFWREAGF